MPLCFMSSVLWCTTRILHCAAPMLKKRGETGWPKVLRRQEARGGNEYKVHLGVMRKL